MGLIKDRHGTYYAQRKVPERLQEALARVLNSEKPKQVFLKKSLGTKVLKEANVAATHVLADFNRTLASAEALLKQRPEVASITDAQIKLMAEHYYASLLAADEEERQEGTGSEPIFQSVAAQLAAAGLEFNTPFKVGDLPEAGLSDREVFKREHALAESLPDARSALSKGDITHVRSDAQELLEEFQLNLDSKSQSYRRLGMAVLTARVKALRDIARRNAGDPVETPPFTVGPVSAPASGGTLREALEGWKKERERPEDGVHEYTRAIDMFIEMHGDLPIAGIKRSHASQFRDALRQVPKTRSGPLLNAGLLELRQWGQEHPQAPKVSAGTVNKQLGAMQAIIGWGFRHGLVPDEVPETDPFKNLRVEGTRSTRDAFDPHGLQAVFDAALFTEHAIPEAGKGATAVWLPLLAVFMGARQNELASLRVSDIREDAETDTSLMWIAREAAAGKRVKSDAGERVVPLHPQIIQLGFLEYVAQRNTEEGENAWLFPAVAPDQRGGRKAWGEMVGPLPAVFYRGHEAPPYQKCHSAARHDVPCEPPCARKGRGMGRMVPDGGFRTRVTPAGSWLHGSLCAADNGGRPSTLVLPFVSTPKASLGNWRRSNP
ncbi:DUF6538 domain-containing protein [Bradyrhizobium sp. 186]|uniref:DUF6538 domain-containing protein n=1 Tax=Bradyrhizobium sp. 186 TaxID=2782654 RepID=UPI0020009538|nr:DUF6538 domain-containing protein [Bradyrhizobium sp. 186]